MTLRGCGYDSDTQRIRAGLVVLLAGIVILLGALGMAVLRGPGPAGDSVALNQQGVSLTADRVLPARVGAALLILAIVLVTSLLIAGYILLRVTRRHAQRRKARAIRPTPNDDVWKMHKLPEDSSPTKGGAADDRNGGA